ncbi:hypothetical protein J4E90_006640 [Alternaria incomplexa]|uniref:uncharacterized protein n=1 Tax=Alternaria incomplexa TaxID=1187928 RepID=UPI002220B7CC|nr:uncharacterized protein J4E90_006640 [Alternaria incomplexa]KAI4911823.1 hypothetical protein J4E90_006640 [Alternaria incomplexa]
MSSLDSEYPTNPDYDDNVSVTSSNEGSVFSISSLASSATDLSKGSGYSAVQIATATRELLSIFRDDDNLQPLYTTAIHGIVGPRRFANTFRRLLKAFADRLKDEAQDRLDFLAARLVALKAREISEAILERYQLGKAPELDELEEREVTLSRPDDQDSSDEDEYEETNVDETVFEELTNIREFLIQSAAFRLLRADLQNFVSAKRWSRKPTIVQQDDMNVEGGINESQKPDPRTDAHARSMESAIESDCFEMLNHDRPLLELYLYAFRVLGIDRFVDDFSDLLHSNAHAPLDRKVDSSIEDSIDEQLITTWQPIASAIALRLEIVDANLASEKDEKCGTETDTSFLLELLSREGDDLKCPAPYDNLNRDLALLVCRDPLRQLLSSVPKRAIDLSERNDTSLSNKTKAFLEDHTMAEWDWWPLAPRVPEIAYGECRLHWKFGGVQLYETLSSLESNIIRNSTPQIAGQPVTNPSIVVPDPSLRVLFGVQGSRWSLEVEQISTALLNDPAFFRELKTRYKKHRHWIKRLISPFRFRFCRFVKLEKFDAGRVLSQGDDLPDYPSVKDDYEYDPGPGTNPMISPKTFAVCLKACDMNCKWPWLNPWHDCKSEFDIQSDDAIAVAWGLEADHAISFAFMAVYHLVPLLAAFGFWIYWLIKFPGDWQNAAVPVLTVLAIFAVLWVPFGKHLGIV